jgi:hypothetical protein
MEGGPKNPGDRDELLENYALYLSSLPLSEEDRELLRSLVVEKPLGTLTITLNKKHIKQLDILPSQTTEELINHISDVFDNLFTTVQFLREDEMNQPKDEKEEYDISFAEAKLH